LGTCSGAKFFIPEPDPRIENHIMDHHPLPKRLVKTNRYSYNGLIIKEREKPINPIVLEIKIMRP
jgi:hypothetical protein